MKQLCPFVKFSLCNLILLILINLNAQAMRPAIQNAIFSVPEKDSYVETYLLIPHSDVVFVADSAGKYQAAVEVTLLFSQAEKVVQFDKYILHSPQAIHPDSVDFDLVDLKRNSLKAGEYDLEIQFRDVNNPIDTAQYTEKITIDAPKKEISIGDIMLVEKYEKTIKANQYSKSGYDLIPNVLNYYPDNLDKLIFYTEIYNTNTALEDDAYVVVYSIKNQYKTVVIKGLGGFKKQKKALVNNLLAHIDIKNLETGNYYLVMEARDKKNQLLASQEIFFQRNKKIKALALSALTAVETANTFVAKLTSEEIIYDVKALFPIASDKEQQFIKNLTKSKNVDFMRQFLYNFWVSRDPFEPKAAFDQYQEQILAVGRLYKSQIFEGYESDRGRTYLKYGKPNNLDISPNEPGMAPFEVWHYYKLPSGQQNVKFIFYNPNQADNDFELIHSNARGEKANNNWKQIVAGGANLRGTDIDSQSSGNVNRHFGTKIDDF